jgi:hypothetical protein
MEIDDAPEESLWENRREPSARPSGEHLVLCLPAEGVVVIFDITLFSVRSENEKNSAVLDFTSFDYTRFMHWSAKADPGNG